MDVGAYLKELTKMGMLFLRGRRKFTKEQSTVWKAMFEKLSDKVIPTAKQTEDYEQATKLRDNIKRLEIGY